MHGVTATLFHLGGSQTAKKYGLFDWLLKLITYLLNLSLIFWCLVRCPGYMAFFMDAYGVERTIFAFKRLSCYRQVLIFLYSPPDGAFVASSLAGGNQQ